MRHTFLVVLTLALAPVAEGGFRPWPEPPPAPVVQPKPATLAEAGGLILGPVPGPCSQTAEWHGPAYQVCPGDVVIVGSGSTWGTALGTGK